MKERALLGIPTINMTLVFLSLFSLATRQVFIYIYIYIYKRLWPFLTMPTQKSLNQHLAFLNLYQHAKNHFIPSVHSSDTANFKVSSLNWPHPFLTMPTPKLFNHLLVSVNLCQHANNQLIPSVHSGETINFRVERLDWPHQFLTIPYQKTFNKLLIFVNLYQHAKN